MGRTLALLGLLGALVGCARSPSNGQEGAACVRLAQCAPGLACVDGACSTDLTALAEAGMVPILDAGLMLDAAVADVVVADVDAGN